MPPLLEDLQRTLASAVSGPDERLDEASILRLPVVVALYSDLSSSHPLLAECMVKLSESSHPNARHVAILVTHVLQHSPSDPGEEIVVAGVHTSALPLSNVPASDTTTGCDALLLTHLGLSCRAESRSRNWLQSDAASSCTGGLLSVDAWLLWAPAGKLRRNVSAYALSYLEHVLGMTL